MHVGNFERDTIDKRERVLGCNRDTPGGNYYIVCPTGRGKRKCLHTLSPQCYRGDGTRQTAPAPTNILQRE